MVLMENQNKGWKPTGTASEMIENVDKAAEKRKKIMNQKCPFQIGDYVTPKKGNKKGRGLPHKVIEVFPPKSLFDDLDHPEEIVDFICMVNISPNDPQVYQNHSKYFELFDPEKVKPVD